MIINLKVKMKNNLIKISDLILNAKKWHTKLFQILLVFLILTNIAFEKTKTYSFLNDKKEITTVFTQEQYDAAIYSSNVKDLIQLAQMRCQINYLYILPEESILLIYLGYFIALTGLILKFKILIKDDKIN